ncbi:MAG: NAD(P)/FAD-dependent oxidoreductase [Dehalococcoidia bacterium]|nr:NAD(P)/FAD-dependent oxidoreductase [Dehalococcoidia bacterium]
MTYDVVVLGAGAAGLMCAAEASRRGRRVVVLERNEAPGKKILISGGGRCNFTNLGAGPGNYYSQNPDFCRSALAAYPPERFIALVESYGIAYHEKKLGQLFCDGSAQQIVDMLLRECAAGGVDVRLGCQVGAVSRRDGFAVETSQGVFESDSLVVATGGLSIPKLGATGLGYSIAKRFGLRRVETRPGLVPLTVDAESQPFFAALSGVAVEAKVACGRCAFVENVLVTHRGLSGPAILQVSNCWREGDALAIDLAPHADMGAVLAAAAGQSRELVTVLAEHLPRRFAQAWCAAFAPSRPMQRYQAHELERIAERLHRWELRPAGTAGYGKAEVTLGGVDTRDLQSKTMEAREMPGLYFIGEVVDVTGWLGGYNFQWAWASGAAAGRHA